MRGVEDLLRDLPVRREIMAMVASEAGLPGSQRRRVTPKMIEAVVESPDGADRLQLPNTEAVVLEFGRPSLLVRDGKFQMPQSKEIRARLLPARAKLEPRLASVGRIEFRDHPDLRWGGTAWMLTEQIAATNAHVARHFAVKSGRTFKPFVNPITGETATAVVDFREEHNPGGGRRAELEIAVRRVVYMAPAGHGTPDIAFLELEASDMLPPPIPVAAETAHDGMDIAVVGYPTRDVGGVTSLEAALETFDDIYDVKRLSPGKVLVADADDWFFTHDATTLRGNSGSVVLDLAGHAVGLHFAGDLEKANYAVKMQTVLDHLPKTRAKSTPLVRASEAPGEELAEGVAQDYADRAGYDPAFLGTTKSLRVDLPTKTSNEDDVRKVGRGRNAVDHLRYEHFSVAMSKSRKLCIWSAANVDGSVKRSARRTQWRVDPRIPRSAQTIGGTGDADVYGNPPKFARGHMTRREDPIWGSDEDAKRGNADSMHLTNAVPQMQPFNAGIWLGLEDYALEHCVEDKMRICVVTGPVFDEGDPERWGIRIPLRFWKAIAFVHDDTKKLTATGYLMSQESFLAPEEFVYGAYETHQSSIAEIERLTDLSFGTLKRADPLRRRTEGVGGARLKRLESYDEIQFI